MVQLTLIRLCNYREWTHSLGEDREYRIQIFQANFYKIIQEIFSKKGGMVLPGKSDEFFVITDGISINEHRDIQKALTLTFPVDVAMFVSRDDSPMHANESLFKLIKSVSFGSDNRVFGQNNELQGPIYVIHADIEGLTKISNENTPFETYELIQKIFQKIAQFFMERNSLSFYMGGDNFVIITDHNAKTHAKELVKYVEGCFGLVINCGIGKAQTARNAFELATTSLDSIRQYRNVGKEKINVIETEYIDDKMHVCTLCSNSQKLEFLR